MSQVVKTEEITNNGQVIAQAGVMIANGGGKIQIPVSEIISTAEEMLNAYLDITGRFKIEKIKGGN